MVFEEYETGKLLLVFVILNSFFILFNKNLSKIFNVYDLPDKKRKFHRGKPALIGGIYLIINLIVFFLVSIFNLFENIDIFLFQESTSLISILFIIFIIGIFDDKYDLNPNLKLIFLCVSLVIFISLNSNLSIEYLKFLTFNKEINLSNYSYFFTLLCILLFMNAFNMMDGANLLAGTYSIIFLIYITIFINFNYINLILINFLLFYLYLNNKNLVFLGDSGSLILSFLISIIVIYNHNLDKIYSEEIFILMSIPGLDMFRLFIERIYNKKNPFFGDRNHLHHLLLNKFNLYQTIFLYNGYFILNLILLNLVNQKILLIIFNIMFYLLVILYLLRYKRKKIK